MPDARYSNPGHRRLAAVLLIRDELGRVLLVKPTYRNGWQLVGGRALPSEAPHHAARRQAMEETQQALVPGELLTVDYTPPEPPTGTPEGITLVFDGGTIPSTTPIRLPTPRAGEQPELSAWQFVPVTELADFCKLYEHRRIAAALDAQLEPKHRGYRIEGLPPTP